MSGGRAQRQPPPGWQRRGELHFTSTAHLLRAAKKWIRRRHRLTLNFFSCRWRFSESRSVWVWRPCCILLSTGSIPDFRSAHCSTFRLIPFLPGSQSPSFCEDRGVATAGMGCVKSQLSSRIDLPVSLRLNALRKGTQLIEFCAHMADIINQQPTQTKRHLQLQQCAGKGNRSSGCARG